MVPYAAMKHPDYPGVTSMKTRHGKIRWRYRKAGQKDVMLPGEPHTPDFDEAYDRIITGRQADVVAFPNAAHPQSLKAAYRILRHSSEWAGLDDKSQRRYSQTIERVLLHRAQGSTMDVGDGPMKELKRSHIKTMLQRFSSTPHMERVVLVCLRKLVMIAIEEEWIEIDPTYGIKRSPKTDGHKAWTAEVMERYEQRWPIGSRQRVAYALALWLGNRASDVTRLKWEHLTTKHVMIEGEMRSVEGFEFVQFKGRKRGKTIFLPMTPMLERELAPLSRDTDTVLVTSRGGPYTDVSLSTRMGEWCAEAGIEPGYTVHGLRKALGVKLAESDASTRQLMETLGHSNIAHAELYSREASQTRLAVQAMDKVSRMEETRRKPALKVVK